MEKVGRPERGCSSLIARWGLPGFEFPKLDFHAFSGFVITAVLSIPVKSLKLAVMSSS
jgi:hypothetical protein